MSINSNIFVQLNHLLNILLLVFVHCLSAQPPREPSIFRSVIDEIPRAITFSYPNKYWATYNTKTGRLSKFWQGDIDFRGEVYTAEKVVQPTAKGNVFLEQLNSPSPFYFKSKEWETLDFQWHGHISTTTKKSIKYILKTPSGSEAILEEIPTLDTSANAFIRSFKVLKNTISEEIAIDINLFFMPQERAFSTNSTFDVEEKTQKIIKGKTYYFISGKLLLSKQTTTTISHTFIK